MDDYIVWNTWLCIGYRNQYVFNHTAIPIHLTDVCFIEKLGLNINYKQLRSKLKIDNPSDTRILSLTVTDPDPENAKEIVNQISMSSSQYIGDLMEVVPPKIIEFGIAS